MDGKGADPIIVIFEISDDPNLTSGLQLHFILGVVLETVQNPRQTTLI